MVIGLYNNFKWTRARYCLWLGLVYICMCNLLLLFFVVFVIIVVVKIMVHTGIYIGGGKLLPERWS